MKLRAVSVAYGVILAMGFIFGSSSFSRAQTLSASSEVANLPLVAPEDVPEFGTFWSLQKLSQLGPLPFNPWPDSPVYWLSGNSFLYDDTAVDYVSLQEQKEIDQALRTLERAYGLNSPEADSEQDDDTGGGAYGPMDAYNYPSNALWLEITTVTNGLAYLIVHGTEPDVVYEILSRVTLTNVPWASEGTLLGAANQDWTSTTVPVLTRTNSLFLWARSWVDTDGDGLPDWYENEVTQTDPNSPDTGNTGVSDGYKDADGDGWSNLQEYQNGTNPSAFNTPPPPRNVAVHVDATGTNVVLSWQSGGGPVSSYGIEAGTYGQVLSQFSEIGQPSASTFAFTNSPSCQLIGGACSQPVYFIRAYFTNGSHSDSQPIGAYKPGLNPDVNLIRGPLGQRYLVVPSPPANLSRILLFWNRGDFTYNYTNVYASNLVNGVALVPAMTGYLGGTFSYQAIATNGDFGEQFYQYPYPNIFEEKDWSLASTFSFVDARVHLKENLKFLLRSATISQPFSYTSNLRTSGSHDANPYAGSVLYPESYYARPASPTNYEYSGFRVFSLNRNHSVMQELRPLRENYLWRNFVHDPTDFASSGGWTNGAGYDYDEGIRTLSNPKYSYSGSGQETPLPLAVSVTNSTWFYYRYIDNSVGFDTDANAEVGISLNGNNRLVLAANVLSGFGLSVNSVRIGRTNLLQPGVQSSSYVFSGHYFAEDAAPQLQTVDYYFASQTPYFQFGAQRPALPGSPDFTVTNTPPLLIASIGQPIAFACWAKQQITNGYADKFAYLEQYFDKAYKIATNGVATTNETGILSPYGEFFPTEPGPAALVTMPDIDTGQRGTGVVYVIKLQLDVNHNGVMDLTFGGADNTSLDRPFAFWVNNDNDGTGVGQDIQVFTNALADFTYGQIRSQRGLEDFARLWICGVPALASEGYSATLALTAISGSPAINLYAAYETNGGTAYLTNASVANSIVTNLDFAPVWVSDVGPYSYAFPTNFFDGSNKYFLFEGSGVGKGELVLTVLKGTNVVAQASASLDLHDIKTFYEQAAVTNVLQSWPNMVQTQRVSGVRMIYSPASGSESKELAVFVHGWRMTEWGTWNFAETMFKRLYWQGFQGRFAALRWPTRSAETELFSGMDYLTYNRSEHIAFKSGTGTAEYLNDLRSRFPDYTISMCAHSMGAIVAMQTLKELAAANQKPLDNLVLMEAAVPAHCFDPSVTNFTPFVNQDAITPTPDTYRDYGAGMTNALRTGGKIINFFNTNDFALATWNLNQAFYNANFLGNGVTTTKPNSFLGYFTDGTTSVLRTNVWNQGFLSTLYGGYYGNGPTRTITNSHELMPFVARPRSEAVGSMLGVHGQIQGQEFDLKTQCGFTGSADDHSGQFNRNIQGPLWLFYSSLKTNLFNP